MNKGSERHVQSSAVQLKLVMQCRMNEAGTMQVQASRNVSLVEGIQARGRSRTEQTSIAVQQGPLGTFQNPDDMMHPLQVWEIDYAV